MQATYDMMTMGDGVQIRVARFDPEGAPQGVVQFVHGFGEHIGMYEKVAEFFTDHGYAFVIHDQRGHGSMPDKTPEQRAKALGVVPSYACFLSDITAIRQQIGTWYAGLPVVLAGLSMGGNIVANYAERLPDAPYACVIIESPWLRLAKPMPGVVTAVARVVGRLHPTLAISSHLDLDAVTRDPVETAAMKADPLYHDRISLKLYAQVLDAGEYAIERAGDITARTLLMCGTGDRIVSVDAIRELAAHAGSNLTLREFPDAYHCLHDDLCRDQVLDTMLTFIEQPTR